MADDTFEVRRSIHVDAPRDEVRARLVDFHAWEAWSPWADLDPDQEETYGGADAGVGATYAWRGDRQVGSGAMEIEEVTDDRVVIDLVFTKPFRTSNTTSFLLEEDADGGTDVDWVLVGPRTFMTKVMGIFTSMDAMVGPDLDRGLRRLKATIEAG